VFVIVIIHLQVTVMVDYSMTNTINILYNGKQEIPQHKNSSNIQINKKKKNLRNRYRGKITSPKTHVMTTHFPGLVQPLQ